MAEIVPFRRPEPTIAGEAMCISCKHTWATVAPVGTKWLECPSCGLHKGAFRYACAPPDGAEWWRCKCGCTIFYMTRHDTVCYDCGAAQYFA